MKTLVQCAKCPWKTTTDPNKIPNGYSCELHEGLSGTIAKDPLLSMQGPLRAMACHESPVGRERHCVGWLANQLGPGNNIGLRLRASMGLVPPFKLVGPQHETFEDTLPKARRR